MTHLPKVRSWLLGGSAASVRSARLRITNVRNAGRRVVGTRTAGTVCLLTAVVSYGGAGGPPVEQASEEAVPRRATVHTAAAASSVPAADLACRPEESPTLSPHSASEYAAMCSAELGVVPTVDCGEGVRIPVTVDGKEIFEKVGNHECDNPNGIRGECIPGSRIGRVTGSRDDGTVLDDVVWAYFCRATGPEFFEKTGLSSVQIIGYNSRSGATCFFEANDGRSGLAEDDPLWSPIQRQKKWLAYDENNVLTGKLPGPKDPEFDDAFMPPGDVQCVACHQNDPFIHNPWIDGARMPDDPDEPVLPRRARRNSPYWVVGGSNWDMRTVHIKGNGCLTCHRAGLSTDKLFSGNELGANVHMPPHKPGSLAEDYAELKACWESGPENTPGCEWVVPPAGPCKGGFVGEDYPHKRDFNKAESRSLF